MPDLSYEKKCQSAGYKSVAGVDEAGRGPLAGPVSAAAVILPAGYKNDLLDDSKKLSEKKRELLYDEIMADERIIWSLSFAEPAEIDEINILKATHAAMARAVDGLAAQVDYCLIDGLPVPAFPYEHEGIVKGDSKSLSIAAASIIAKVSRDRKMLEYAELYPEYGFEKHKGYGTKQHRAALDKHGPCPIHRHSFSPVAQLSLGI
ncbi:ribonuclease HII [Persicirhabdus sediminis]|uniref:Ribonuclease HII n=1 Tax=Persicirhabdus sediminis TaxID=454144 RepID=A0A8J7MER9_9BACT|nr:ribonuclease HII [Persicirhabdus sediminis]MBK1791377.1 ribonuclease HII [Persicirhabdus sediminis]